jgi:hypothetical protein
MTTQTSIITQLQFDTVDESISVTTLLRKAKIIATKLESDDFLGWLNFELNGYADVTAELLPNYRKAYGEPKALSPYNGWQPIQFEDTDTREHVSYAPIGEPIGSIERIAKKDVCADGRGRMQFGWTPTQKQRVLDAIGGASSDVMLELPTGYAARILDAVRGALLDWALGLEVAGVKGEGLSFSLLDKKTAAPVTQNIYAQNIGVVGDLAGEASVTNHQSSLLELTFENVSPVIDEIERCIPLLPEEVRREVDTELRAVRLEYQKPPAGQDKALIKSSLSSIKNIGEAIAGNVVAQGIVNALQGFAL